MTLVASASSSGVSIEGIFLQYGLIGVVALVLGYYARNAIKATEERAKRLEDDNRRLYTLMAEQMMPVLTKATDVIAMAVSIMKEQQKRDEINAAVQAARQREPS